MESAADICVIGEVQGVGFRWFVLRRATELGIIGYVRNRPDGAVEIHAEGEKSAIESLIGSVRIGPRSARVEDVSVEWVRVTTRHTKFDISHD